MAAAEAAMHQVCQDYFSNDPLPLDLACSSYAIRGEYSFIIHLKMRCYFLIVVSTVNGKRKKNTFKCKR